jgi:hypothetical protein
MTFRAAFLATFLITASAAAGAVSPTACGTYDGHGCAPPSQRIDLFRPRFSHPTHITNRLFPISRLRSVVLLGHVSGMPFRTETTLLPGTQVVSWDGRRVRCRLSQYVAYLNGRIDEVALDRYAQADDGSVWYFGEDVFDYRAGAIAITEGTWLAGREGPAAMIMPADPKVGDVFRLENIPGVVFEEVKLTATNRTVAGPHGAVHGALFAEELHSDHGFDHKVYAPGYGEFQTTGGGDLEALALGVPADSLSHRMPVPLAALSLGANAILESARIADWPEARATLARVEAAWAALPRVAPPPPKIAAAAEAAILSLGRAVGLRHAVSVEQAAIDAAQSFLDLELRHQPSARVDAARFVLWTQQLRVHAAAHDLAGVTGDVATLEWIRQRLSALLRPRARRELDQRLLALRAAADARNLASAADQAARLGARLRNLTP